MPERKLDPNVSNWTVQALGRLFYTYAIYLGIAIVLGGDPRFSAPSYASAMGFPGAPESWGVVVALAGAFGLVTSLAGHHRLVQYGLYALAAWSFFFGLAFADAALANPMAGTTGPPAYGVIGITCIVLGVAHRKASRG